MLSIVFFNENDKSIAGKNREKVEKSKKRIVVRKVYIEYAFFIVKGGRNEL